METSRKSGDCMDDLTPRTLSNWMLSITEEESFSSSGLQLRVQFDDSLHSHRVEGYLCTT
ncbi:unnamed protein product [Acidithrix sp. C25]|nr:unnamed protein product [Acidithrix sp. C25]